MFGIIVSGRLVNFLSLVFVANIALSFYVDYTIYLSLSISTASPPLGDYVQVRVSAMLVEEMLLKIKVPIRFVSWSGIKDDRVKMLKVRNWLTVIG